MISIGENLRKIRQTHKLTQGDVAESLGIERSTYTCYEIGKTEPSIPCLIKMAKMYNVSLSYLIFGYEESKPSYFEVPSTLLSEDDPDPIYLLPKDEKLLLIAFRLLSKESKQFIIEKTREVAKSEEQQ